MVDECNDYIAYLNTFPSSTTRDEEILRTEEIIEECLEDLHDWNKKVKEYPTAAQVWRWATEEMGFSNYVAAGIVGNMMAEVGGHTLALRPNTRVGNYYGLCMWYLKYSPRVNGRNTAGQLDFLAQTMKSNMGTSNYKALLRSKSAAEASIIFAKYYERCANPYGRQKDAIRAYRFFAT